MKLSTLLEARQRADVNKKTSINSQLVAIANEHPNSFVSFTVIDKLGINPSSRFTTPIGIYAYPIKFVTDETVGGRSMKVLPYAGEAPYVNVFQSKGTVIDLNHMSDDEADGYLNKLKGYLERSFPNVAAEFDEVSRTNDGHRQKLDIPVWKIRYHRTPGARLWNVTQLMAEGIATDTGRAKTSAPIIWNKLLRSIGIDGAIDNGQGIIHSNEKTQAVFFHSGAIHNLQRILNKYSPDDVHASRRIEERRQFWLDMLRKRSPEQIIEMIEKTEHYWLINLVRDQKLRNAILTKFPNRVTKAVKQLSVAEIGVLHRAWESRGLVALIRELDNTNEKFETNLLRNLVKYLQTIHSSHPDAPEAIKSVLKIPSVNAALNAEQRRVLQTLV